MGGNAGPDKPEACRKKPHRNCGSRAQYTQERIMPYVDGFVIPVPKANREAYVKLAEQAAAVFKEYGALKVVECWGDDVPEGKITSFPMAVKPEGDERAGFSWIILPSRAVRA